MRSPWLVGLLGLIWLAGAAVLADGPIDVVTLWVVGVSFVAYVGLRERSKSSSKVVQAEKDAVSATLTQRDAPGPRIPPGRGGDPTHVGIASGLVVLSAAEVAELLSLDVAAIVEAMKTGRMPGNCIDGEWRCSERALATWLDGSWHSTGGT
jgi:hypothetical protein